MTEPDTVGPIHAGGCLCGAVRYVASGALRDVVFCHCSQCRRQTGLYFAATAVDKTRLAIKEDGALRWFAASTHARRGFCGTCGSVMFWQAHGSDQVAILAGSLDDPSGLRAAAHIFTKGRPTFYALCDGLAQHEGAAPGVQIA